MSGGRAAEWPEYYQKTAGRSARLLLLHALERCGAASGAVRRAVDVGCGDGTETCLLLERGWHVTAVDGEPEAITRLRDRPAAHAHADRLHTQVATFDTLICPPAELVYAGLSLFFCPPSAFEALWLRLTAALVPGGVVAAHLLGDRDSWAARADMTSHTAAAVRTLLRGCAVEYLAEVEHDGTAVSGPKHWHLWEVVARVK
ncbi:MAG: trans-aconitate 2-methyltransferase [Vicinamibacterales bacterium]